MAIGEAREGYELWRPNRAKSGSLTARFVVILLLAISVVLMALILIGGYPILKGGTTMAIFGIVYALLYVIFAIMIARWSRGALTVAAAFAILLLIFCAVGANSWFARDKAGFEQGAFSSDLVGLLVVILIPVQVLLMVATLIGFNQEWHVEEERPIRQADEGEPQPG